MSIERFWLRATDSDSWREVTLQEFVRAERMAGFRNTMGRPDRPATAAWGVAGGPSGTTAEPAVEYIALRATDSPDDEVAI